ncbi:hypothetical protein GR925_01665 [Streptomyces sp. HUCO-GS316]|uniref:hypothetical protein n=1 Tax=Streptomyces sp. HUCO-GS316 TaxID=2692198 RepID=UPI00136B458D|nr:hypothetical protein [Streptomyces sp. HUCO-GS316]MXM62190.1 hypothetical protein [Streptomyces sp. HUCO-GS316]
MNTVTQIVLTDLVCRLGVSPAAVETALVKTVQHFDSESRNPIVARTGRTPAEYLATSLTTPRFHAMLASIALKAEGREADARLAWEAYVQREIATATRAHEAVPETALLGDVEAVRRIGRGVGLDDDQTDQLIPGIVLTLAMGYYYRPAGDQHLTLTEALSRVAADELTEMLRHASLSAAGRTEDAAHALRRFQQGSH